MITIKSSAEFSLNTLYQLYFNNYHNLQNPMIHQLQHHNLISPLSSSIRLWRSTGTDPHRSADVVRPDARSLATDPSLVRRRACRPPGPQLRPSWPPSAPGDATPAAPTARARPGKQLSAPHRPSHHHHRDPRRSEHRRQLHCQHDEGWGQWLRSAQGAALGVVHDIEEYTW